MAEVKVFFEREGNTLTVWFGNPQDEYVCEETGEGAVLIKNKAGEVIGLEKLNFSKVGAKQLKAAFGTVTA